jgi:hypothetical protein
MKNKLFFLLVLPMVWFVITTITNPISDDRAYLLAVAPSAWLFFFESPLSVTTRQMQFSGLPLVFLVGLVLFKFKMKPLVTIISSVVITFILWIALLSFASEGTAIKVPGVPLTWLLYCFNFSLCLLPFFALPVKLIIKIYEGTKGTTDTRFSEQEQR